MDSIISLKTRNEFREYFVGSTLREIQEAFDACQVRCDLDFSPPVSGQRRTLVEQYYHSIDWSDWRSVSKVVRLYESELKNLYAPSAAVYSWATMDEDKEREHRKKIADKFLYWLNQDGFEWINGRLIRANGTPSLDHLTETVQRLEGSHLASQIQRIKDAVESDPALAIGTAKELIETVCKTILEERGKPVDGTPDIPTLTKTVLRELKLVPEGIQDAVKGADLIKAVLRSLGTIGNDIGQLRGLYGTGHGKTAKTQGLQSRHARLAVGAASTLVTFLFETHEETRLAITSPIQPRANQ